MIVIESSAVVDALMEDPADDVVTPPTGLRVVEGSAVNDLLPEGLRAEGDGEGQSVGVLGVPTVKFNAVEPGIMGTSLGGGDPGSHPGRPAKESARVVARLAMIGVDGPTGTFQEDAGELRW